MISSGVSSLSKSSLVKSRTSWPFNHSLSSGETLRSSMNFFRDVRVALGQNIKCELPYRFRSRGGRGDARDEVERSVRVLCAGGARQVRSTQHHRKEKAVRFSHQP